MNNFAKFVFFLAVVTICVFISSLTTPKTVDEFFSSQTYIKSIIDDLDAARKTFYERQNLGLETDTDIELINYKKDKLESFLYRGYSLSMPCENYCDYLKDNEDKSNTNGYIESEFGETEETQQCYAKYLLSVNLLQSAYNNTLQAYNNESISKKEFEDMKANLQEKDKKIIDEVNKVLELEAVPNEKACTKP